MLCCSIYFGHGCMNFQKDKKDGFGPGEKKAGAIVEPVAALYVSSTMHAA